MSVQSSYDEWSLQYDSNENKTRDLEAVSLRKSFKNTYFKRVLEIGCGTGKNTLFFIELADETIAVDLSSQMLNVAKTKINSSKVSFVQADIHSEWEFAQGLFDLVSFSLILEHINNLQSIFKKASEVMSEDALLYISELHPFKQYSGSKARFETPSGVSVVECYTHHISDYTDAAQEAGLKIKIFKEYFDSDDRNNIPRLLTIIFEKA